MRCGDLTLPQDTGIMGTRLVPVTITASCTAEFLLKIAITRPSHFVDNHKLIFSDIVSCFYCGRQLLR